MMQSIGLGMKDNWSWLRFGGKVAKFAIQDVCCLANMCGQWPNYWGYVGHIGLSLQHKQSDVT